MLAEVRAARGHLARHAHQRDRALRGEPAGVQLRGRAPGEEGRGRRRAQRSAGAPAAVASHDPPLDRRGAAGLDQLLADRPGERLERLRPPPRPHPRLPPDDRADQRIPPEAAMELAQVVVGAEREAHPLDRDCARLARSRRSLAAASARIRTAFPAAQARTSTSSSPIHSALVSAPSRHTITPSRPGPGSR